MFTTKIVCNSSLNRGAGGHLTHVKDDCLVKVNEDRVIQFTAIFLGLYPSSTILTNEREVYYDKIEGEAEWLQVQTA